VIAALTGIGLAAAAGLNAYIPFLLVALLSRFTDVLELPAQYAWIESNWAIAISAVLLVSEMVLDKIAVVDHLNDLVATLIRPTVGGLIFVATSAAAQLDESTWMRQNPWVGFVLGVVVAGIVHTGKALARPVVNVSTLGVGTPVVSTVEDGASFTMSLIAIFTPILVVVALVLLGWAMITLFRRGERRRRARAGLP
jgi:hypothetical protein